jgi:hypothetical protein
MFFGRYGKFALHFFKITEISTFIYEYLEQINSKVR